MSKGNFERVLSRKDVFALAFGAMIGWGWVVLAGSWVNMAGTLGSIVAFLFGGIMVLFVGLTYAELTSAMPECGGEHVFSHRALGANMSFVCTWAIILGYVSVVAFEAVAFPTVVEYLFPNYIQLKMYTVAGYDVYFTWVLVGVISSIAITVINYLGVKPAAFLQGVLTILIALIGISFFSGALVNGEVANMKPLFTDGMKGILGVAVMTPFMYVGFDVIPQAAEEINMPFNKIGKLLVLSVVMAIVWYIMIIIGVSLALDKAAMEASSLVTADAMKAVFNGSGLASKILIIGGIGGIITSWNSFFVGGSRAIYSMAESKMLPSFLAKLHPKYKTPTNAILLIGVLSMVAPLFGRKMLVWLVDAGGLTIVVAYLIVSISFLVLRKKEPNMPRPYKVKRGKAVGTMAVILSGLIIILYLPGAPAALVWPYEWVIIIGWSILGAIFYAWAKVSYSDFGVHEFNLDAE
ncbi:APC family permease [Clostridium grantii]|uniref:Amino acid/polyamine/organocation transporter, APC superfamily n=1 Tax=Clostridium grantii DSM 8605 TaxID=1121316 RepID=A0A1M5WMG5_9CLOT|nr:APC family permease [Clostridium grantii]SHH88612.1 amino acid/polyamine/organocation transporter, APC superfamily [Clostridium grantii DSM 8605]